MPEFVSVENVRISLLPATLFQRFAAIAIDIVLVLIVIGLSSLVGFSFYTRELDPFIPLFFLFFFFLPVLEEITFNGRSSCAISCCGSTFSAVSVAGCC